MSFHSANCSGNRRDSTVDVQFMEVVVVPVVVQRQAGVNVAMMADGGVGVLEGSGSAGVAGSFTPR